MTTQPKLRELLEDLVSKCETTLESNYEEQKKKHIDSALAEIRKSVVMSEEEIADIVFNWSKQHLKRDDSDKISWYVSYLAKAINLEMRKRVGE